MLGICKSLLRRRYSRKIRFASVPRWHFLKFASFPDASTSHNAGSLSLILFPFMVHLKTQFAVRDQQVSRILVALQLHHVLSVPLFLCQFLSFALPISLFLYHLLHLVCPYNLPWLGLPAIFL